MYMYHSVNSLYRFYTLSYSQLFLPCPAGSVAQLVAAYYNNRPISGEVQVQFAKLMDAVSQADCNSHCQSGGNGNGVVIGTAPFCGGDCSSDCRSDHCMPWPANCWTGNKICCCASKLKDILYY